MEKKRHIPVKKNLSENVLYYDKSVAKMIVHPFNTDLK